jgi:TonB family protein
MTGIRRLTLIAVCAIAVVVCAQELRRPARYKGGMLPPMPTTAVGGGEVFVELDVDREGRVTGAKALRTTPPFGDLVVRAVRAWQFAPAEEPAADRGRADAPSLVPVASKMLVAALFRPPTLNTPTLGEAPRDVAAASDEVAVPLSTVAPPYPPTALNGGIVLLEADVDAGGLVQRARVLRSAPPFDAPALDALRTWRFRPARWRGQPAPTVVYVMVGFAVPVV